VLSSGRRFILLAIFRGRWLAPLSVTREPRLSCHRFERGDAVAVNFDREQAVAMPQELRHFRFDI